MTAALDAPLRKLITMQAELVSLLGNRIYSAGAMPTPAVFPLMTFEVQGVERTRHMGGSSGLAKATVELNVWSLSKAQLSDLVDRTRLALNEQRATVLGTELRKITMDGEQDVPANPADGSSDSTFGSAISLTIWWREGATP